MQLIEFDPRPYLAMPRTTARNVLVLGRLLRAYTPTALTPEAARAAAYLDDMVTEFSAALVERYRAASASETRQEDSEIDSATDGLWYVARDRFDHWAVFERRGVALAAKRQTDDGFDFAARMAKAARARELRRRLLGKLGVDFTRRPYQVQAEHMMTLWTMIEHEQLGPEISDLIGADFYGGLEAMQVEYEKMIERRTAHEQNPSVNFNDVRVRLQRTIVKYNAALVAMADEADEASVDSVRAALSPMVMLRKQLANAAGGIAEEGDADIDIDTLVAEQKKVERELSLPPDDDELPPETEPNSL